MFEFERRRAMVHTRPRRRAIVVHRDAAVESLLDLLGRMSSVWGGYYTIIVPTDGEYIEPVWLKHLHKFDPDVVGSALPPDTLSKRVRNQILRSSSPFQLTGDDPILSYSMALSFSETPLKSALLSFGETWVADMDLESFPLLARVFFHGRFGLVDSGLASALGARGNQSIIHQVEDSIEIEIRQSRIEPTDEHLLDLLYKYFRKGDHAPRTVEQMVQRGELRVEEVAQIVGSTNVLNHLPLNITRIGIEELLDSKGLSIIETTKPQMPVCVVGDRVPDYALAHNLLRLKREPYWLPVRTPPNDDDVSILAKLVRAVALQLASEVRREGGEVPIVSTTVDEPGLQAFREWLAQLGSRIVIISTEAPTEPEEYEKYQRQRRDEEKAKLIASLKIVRPDTVRIFTTVPRFRDAESVEILP
ncbi:MAG: hypothetical protein ACE5IJ_11145, partial [Thermoplasmata archaeon]